MPRFQYRVVNLGMFRAQDRMVRVLGDMGSAGWELVVIYDKSSNWLQGMEKGFALFKREVPDGQKPVGPWAEGGHHDEWVDEAGSGADGYSTLWLGYARPRDEWMIADSVLERLGGQDFVMLEDGEDDDPREWAGRLGHAPPTLPGDQVVWIVDESDGDSEAIAVVAEERRGDVSILPAIARQVPEGITLGRDFQVSPDGLIDLGR